MRPRFNIILRAALIDSRWGMAPFCLGLLAALAIVLVQFTRELAHLFAAIGTLGEAEIMLGVLKLIDLVLIANLVVMIIAAAVEMFLPTGTPATRPNGSESGDIAALKPKLFASISAIAAIDLLENVLNLAAVGATAVLCEAAILLAFVVSGVLLAWTERLSAREDRREA